ncbi:MAG: hypothetical protein A2283_19400 [Lentisphaerae bacterium RIFOXYA12_FULL_48_11]|nr:MAG: hypothetical protein A2283_19400 [Lentisphaerae bacterium RIFOXYA12_FULL_48_11]
MIKITTFLMLSLVVMLQTAICQEPKAPARNAPAAVTEPQGQLASEKTARDPFWPIGYWPQKKDESGNIISTAPGMPAIQTPGKTNVVVAPKEIVISWPELKVKGLTRQGDGTYIAIIDGVGIVEKGQIIQIQRDGFIFKYKISDINQKGILQQKLDYKPKK